MFVDLEFMPKNLIFFPIVQSNGGDVFPTFSFCSSFALWALRHAVAAIVTQSDARAFCASRRAAKRKRV